MTPSVHKVFLSSTNADLADYRDAVYTAVSGNDHLKCIDFRTWGPRPAEANGLCRSMVGSSDLFVGLLGRYRGWEVPGDNAQRSITEMEFDWAVAARKPRFICVTPDDFPLSVRETDDVYERQQKFRRRVMSDGANVVSQDFSTPDKVASNVTTALLSHLLAEQMRKAAPNADVAKSADSADGVRAALTRLAEDKEADLDELLDNPGDVDAASLEARLAARAEGLLKAQARAQKLAAQYYRHIGSLAFLRDTQKAIDAFRKASDLDPDNAEVWRQIGVLSIRKSHFAEAADALQRASDRARADGNLSLQARVAGNLGAIDYYQGRFADAERRFAEDHRISRELANKPGIARSSGNLGLIYTKLGRPRDAEIMHLEALDVARATGNREEEARQIGNIGEVKVALGDLDAAHEHHSRALAIDEELDNREGQARHAGNLGEIEIEQGRLETAEANIRRALAIDEDLKNRAGQMRHWRNLGKLCTKKSEHAEARRYYFKALALAKELQISTDAAAIALDMAEACMAEGDTAEAQRWCGEADPMIVAVDSSAGAKLRERLGALERSLASSA